GSEVAWALWAAVSLGVGLTASAAAAIGSIDDDFVASIALDANSRGLFPAGALDTTGWETLIDYDEVLFGADWLLAYEATHKGWARSAAPRVAADAFFSVLQGNGVHFYDPQPRRKLFTGPAGPLPGGTLPESYL